MRLMRNKIIFVKKLPSAALRCVYKESIILINIKYHKSVLNIHPSIVPSRGL